jgi:hypothetical protein
MPEQELDTKGHLQEKSLAGLGYIAPVPVGAGIPECEIVRK